MTDLELAEKKIVDEIESGPDWTNPYWLDDIKNEFPEVFEDILDDIYTNALKKKIESLGESDLRQILRDQETSTSANQNYLLQHLIEERLKE